MAEADNKRIKKYQESVFGNMPGGQGPADKKFTTTSETGIPITESQNIIQSNQKYATDLPLAPFQIIGNAIMPGQPFGKKNQWLQNEEQKKIYEAKVMESQAYTARKEQVRSQLATIFDKADKRFKETGDEKYHQMAMQAKNEIFSAAGFTDGDFLPVGPETYRQYDEFGLFTNQPNPYPMINALGEGVIGTVGAVKGFNMTKPGFGLVKKVAEGMAKGFVKGKGGWATRALSSIIYGGAAVAAADFGYEAVLDTMDRAGKAKAYLAMEPEERSGAVDAEMNTLLDKALRPVDMVLAQAPDALTFGAEGINRPKLGERTQAAIDEGLFDAGISTAFFGIRPLYLGLKAIGGSLAGLKAASPSSKVFGKEMEDPIAKEMFKDFGSPTPQEIVAAEQRLMKFDPKNPMVVGAGGRALLPFGNIKSIPAKEEVQMNIPVIGKAFSHIINSKAFNWLGPANNKSKSFVPGDTPLDEIAGTTLPRFSVAGRPYIGAFVNAFQRVPAFGGPIRAGIQVAGEAQKVRAMEMLGRFAPYVTTADMGVDYIKLAGKTAKGFREQAVKYDKEILQAAKSAGAIVDKTQLVNTAKEILFRYSKMGMDEQRKYGAFARFLNKEILQAPENFVPGTQLLAQNKIKIGDMYALKKTLDSNYQNWAKSPDIGTMGDDINLLYKAFETDVGSLSKTPYANVSKLWAEYEQFLSNGMLLFGTNVGKNLANVKRFGFNVAVGESPANASKNLWNVLAKSTDTGAFVPDNLLALKNIVGEQAYNSGLGHYITNIIKKSVSDVEGIQYINPDLLAAGMGIGKSGSPIQELFKKALPGPTVPEYKIFNGAKNRWENWYEDLWGKIPSNIPRSEVKAVTSSLPTYKDFEDLNLVLDRIFKYGMPNQSTFLARSTVLQGPVGAMKSSSPAAGMLTAYGTSTAAGAVAPILAMAPFFGFRYLGKIVTNRIRMRNWKNAMDDTLPLVLRTRNLERLIQEMPDEYEEWYATVKDMESANRKRNMMNLNNNAMKNMQQGVSEAIPGILQGVGNAVDAIPAPLRQPVTETIKESITPEPNTYQDGTAAYTSGGGSTGSAITGSNVMNSNAAASLYTGNTDQALANQYSMNDGGAVELNPVMGNDGKFNKPQKQMNDNPFTKKGMMS